MAGLFDYQDPESVGRMMFAAGLLNAAGPSRMPVSTGQALSQGLIGRQQGASEAAQTARRNELIAAQIRHMAAQDARLAKEAKGAGMPAPVRTAMWYADPSTTDAERKAFGYTVRNNVVRGPNGELYMNDPAEGLRRLTSFEQTLIEKQDLSSADAYGTGLGKAATTPREVLGPDGRQTFGTDLQALVQAGLIGAPRISQPGFGAAQPIRQPMPQSAPPPMSRRNLDVPPGFPPDGVASQEELRRRLAVASGIPGADQPAPAIAPVAQAKADEASRFKISSLENSVKAAEAAIKSLDGAADKVDWLSSGLVGGVTQSIPGLPGFNLKERLLPVKSVQALEGLKQMRLESPTGAAVGNVALGELEIFMSKWGSLNTGTYGPQLLEQMKDAKEHLNDAVKYYKKAIEAEKQFLEGKGRKLPSDIPDTAPPPPASSGGWTIKKLP